MSLITPNLEAVINCSSGRLWRGRTDTTGIQPALSTGHKALDDCLPDGGWPQGVVTELLLPAPANGELRLLLPAMQALSASGRWLSWINPPAIPYAPALAQAGIDLQRNLWLPDLTPQSAWWAMEQLVQHPCSGLVLGWLEPLHQHVIRRLQLAVEKGGGMAVLCRQIDAQYQHSAAALRLLVQLESDGLQVSILKSRNSLRRQVITLV